MILKRFDSVFCSYINLAVQHIESALKVAIACMKYKIMKAECLLNIGRLDVSSSYSFEITMLNKLNFIFLGSE